MSKLFSLKMIPALLSLVIAAFSVSILLGLPKVVETAQTFASAANVAPTEIPETEVAGVAKVNPIPKDNNLQVPYVTATAVLIKDLEADYVLYVKDPDKKVPIASTTKIMTALVAGEYFKPNDVLTVQAASLVEGSSMGLKVGEQLTFRSILYGMLLNSGNDAAYTIADNYPGGRNGFLTAMNAKSTQLGLLNTHFENPAGFDGAGHYSSAADLAKIAELATQNSQFARVVSTKDTTVFSTDKTFSHPLKNLNKLLGEPGVLGIKTGTTPAAKENLVALVERDGHRLLTVVLGSNDRFLDTEQMINWAFTNFVWQ